MNYLNELRNYAVYSKKLLTSQGDPYSDHVFGAFSFAYYCGLINADEYDSLCREFFPL